MKNLRPRTLSGVTIATVFVFAFSINPVQAAKLRHLAAKKALQILSENPEIERSGVLDTYPDDLRNILQIEQAWLDQAENSYNNRQIPFERCQLILPSTDVKGRIVGSKTPLFFSRLNCSVGDQRTSFDHSFPLILRLPKNASTLDEHLKKGVQLQNIDEKSVPQIVGLYHYLETSEGMMRFENASGIFFLVPNETVWEQSSKEVSSNPRFEKTIEILTSVTLPRFAKVIRSDLRFGLDREVGTIIKRKQMTGRGSIFPPQVNDEDDGFARIEKIRKYFQFSSNWIFKKIDADDIARQALGN